MFPIRETIKYFIKIKPGNARAQRPGRCAFVTSCFGKCLVVMKAAFSNMYLIIHNPINKSMFFSNSPGPISLILIF